jgi:hypothetical protein
VDQEAKEASEMGVRWTVSLLLALCLCMAVVGAALAEEIEPSFELPSPPEPPEAMAGVYVTSEDNENNVGTG